MHLSGSLRPLRARPLLCLVLAAMSVTLVMTTVPTPSRAVSVALASSTGVADRGTGEVEESSLFAMPAHCYTASGQPELGACRLLPRRAGAPTLVVWGDSHAREMLAGIIKAIGTRRVNLVAYIAGACPPVDPGHGPDAPARIAAGCEKHNALAVRDLTRMAKNHRRVQVVASAAWELYRNAIDGQYGRWQTYNNDYLSQTARLVRYGVPRLFRTMERLGITTHVVGQAPMVPLNPPRCEGAYDNLDPAAYRSTDYAYPCALPLGTTMVAAKPLRLALRERMRLLSPAHRGILVQPSRPLCPDARCPGLARGAEVWNDPVHISVQSSERLAPAFAPVVRAVVAARPVVAR